MHIELDLKLTLNGSASANEHQLALALRSLAHLLTISDSAQANVALALTTAPAERTAPQVLRATEWLTVAEPAPAATQPEPAPAAQVEPPAASRRGKPAGLGFEEYDRLVRSEMKRLSRGGVMPGYTYWDKARDPSLPTLLAIIRRYGFNNPAQLAEHLGYLAPESRRPAAQ